MPIDYSIPAKFGQLQVQVPNPIPVLSTLAALRQQTAQMEAVKAEQQKQQTLSSLLPQAINQDGTLNAPVINQLSAIDIDAPVKVAKMRDAMFPQMAAAPDQYSADFKIGIDEKGNRVYVQPSKSGGFKVVEGITPPKEEGPKPPQGYRFDQSGNLVPIPGGPADTGSAGGGMYDRLDKLQTQYENQSKMFDDVTQTYNNVMAATDDSSGVGDSAIVTMYNKFLDPSTGVRDPEVERAMQATGTMNQVKAWFTKTNDGQSLTPESRKEFKRIMSKFYDQYRLQQKTLNERTAARAKQLGIDPGRLVLRNPGLPGEITTPGADVNGTKIPAKKSAPKMNQQQIDKILQGGL